MSIDDFLRTIPNIPKPEAPVKKKQVTVKNDKLVSYYHGLKDKQPFIYIRGKGLTESSKSYLKDNGFVWRFRSGRKMVMAWEAMMEQSKMVSVLSHLKTLGCDVQPYGTLNEKKVFDFDERLF